VNVQYRLAQEAPFPGAVCDVKCAILWLRANAGVFNTDSDRIAALGYSVATHTSMPRARISATPLPVRTTPGRIV
jgi:pectinesterase